MSLPLPGTAEKRSMNKTDRAEQNDLRTKPTSRSKRSVNRTDEHIKGEKEFWDE